MSKGYRKTLLRFLKKMTFLPSKLYVHFLYEYFTGKKLNLKNPIEFNEKIQWYKVYYRPKILNQLVDKHAVRSYVIDKIGEQYLNDIYFVCDSVSEVDFKRLPNSFVVKGLHSSGYNLIVRDKKKLNISKTKRLFRKWLRTNHYYRTGKEWAYKDVKPRLLFEKVMNEETRESLTDYKFYCFNGKAKFVDVHLDREESHKRAFYDLEFNKLPMKKLPIEKFVGDNLQKPSNYEEMGMLAEKLAVNLPFVRVDFYSINGKTVFGELTFYPADGRKDFFPNEYNKIVGDYFELPKIPDGEESITKFP